MRTWRVPPSPWVALGVFLAYVVVVNGIQRASGIPYAAFFASAENALRSAGLSLAAGSVVLLAFAAWARWDGLWRDPGRLPMTALMWVAPVLFVVIFVVRFVLKLSAGGPSGNLLGAILVAGVLVGLAEELLFRGIVLRSLRINGRPEARAMLFSSLWFGGMHAFNALLGTPIPLALGQSGLAAVQGMTLYQFRRATGWLVPGMVAHGLWDMSSFLPGGEPTVFSSFFELGSLGVMVIAGLVSGVAVLVHDRETTMAPRGPAATTAAPTA